jgi:hypothetical protein
MVALPEFSMKGLQTVMGGTSFFQKGNVEKSLKTQLYWHLFCATASSLLARKFHNDQSQQESSSHTAAVPRGTQTVSKP